MKKTLFVVLTAAILVSAMAGAAFAARYDAVYEDPTTGNSPHGGYLTTSDKCAVCHAVHNPGGISALSAADKADQAQRDAALGSSEVLLRSSVTNACIYCHVNAANTFDIKMVYGGDPAYYDGTSVAAGYSAANGHTGFGGAMDDTTVNCTNCHQVHGAASMMASTDAYMVKKILKYNNALKDDDAPAIAANPIVAPATEPSVNEANMSGYCTQCHKYYNSGYNGDSHTMRAGNVNYTNGSASVPPRGTVVAFSDSTNCRSCHQRGNTNQAAATDGANNYPHYTDGYRFLAAGANVENAAASAGSGDGNCLVCHVSWDGVLPAVGVGQSY